MRSFQDAADESGLTRNFHMSNLGCSRVMDLYNGWQKTIAPEWRSGAIVEMQLRRKSSVLLLTLEGGATMTIKLQTGKGK